MAASEEEVSHLRELFAETRRRHDKLEVQAARYGPNRVPAEIAIELQEAKESMERLNAKMRIVTVPQNVQDATGPEASIDVLRLHVKDLRDQFGTMWRYLEHMILEMKEDTRVWREAQQEARDRGVWERRVVEAVLFALVLIALYLALR
jgi:hypothetical protein